MDNTQSTSSIYYLHIRNPWPSEGATYGGPVFVKFEIFNNNSHSHVKILKLHYSKSTNILFPVGIFSGNRLAEYAEYSNHVKGNQCNLMAAQNLWKLCVGTWDGIRVSQSEIEEIIR